MKRSAVVAVVLSSVLAGSLAATAPAGAAPPPPVPDDRLDVYVGDIQAAQVADIVALGVDRHELEVGAVTDGTGSTGSTETAKAEVAVEAVLSGDQAAQLREAGLDLELKATDDGSSVAQRASARAAEGYEVWQTYSGEGGLQEEIQQLAADHPDIAKLVTVGQSTNGTDIQAVKVTRAAVRRPDGSRPATLFMGAQHAREWITPEMTTRLLTLVLDSYGEDRDITRLVNQTEMWFLPVANPDGYDFTFQPGQRLWRKNLRDNNGDGVISTGDGVDLNRNWDYRWGYDNEGSSPNPASETYRGPGPNSEAETEALDELFSDVGFEFVVNYHSAAELLLHGVGWQVATPTPDDVIYEAMVGDDENPAVPGYDPDLAAELYTTNGDTDSYAQAAYGSLGFTPEMATCESASESVPDDEWEAADCGSGFEFPDDEDLVQAEFERNIPFALAVAQSAVDPDDPVSVVGRTAADFVVDSFDVSYGDPQTVAVTAKRALTDLRLSYRVNGGPVRTEPVTEWEGGSRYGGDENADYYAEYRAAVSGTEPGDSVQVWFTAGKRGYGRVQSERFTYDVQADTGADVLVVANEDWTGVNPTYPESVTAPKYADAHVAAVEAAGYEADVWDVDRQGVPHDLAVLGHYDAVVWYVGDNRISMDPEDELTEVLFAGVSVPDSSVKESQQYLTIAVRDYLNEGGTLVHAGETAQWYGLLTDSNGVGGLYYGLNGDPTAECVITESIFDDCLLLADDFRQYWLGGYTRGVISDPTSVAGSGPVPEGTTVDLGGPVVEGDNPLDEAGTFVPTSDVLPVEEFPQFASSGAAEYTVPDGAVDPYAPTEGDWYVGVLHEDSSYTRLTRTVDLSGATSGELAFQLSANTEADYDFVIVEARTPGGDDWTTLPEAGGLSSTDIPADCADSPFLLELHPFLTQYLGGPACTSPDDSWNAITGSTDGWQDVAYDLSGFAGRQVEVSVTYVSDPAFAGVGAFVDDTRVTVDGVVTTEGFESGLGVWTITGEPAGSPPSAARWERSQDLVNIYAGTATDSTLLLGFGLEQVATDAERAALVEAALDGLLAD